ncbi:MAG: carboxypeptidase-like regulatory domain-containing protein, partial [Bacteroidetes bacterium]|nr:carboxypeptidase-like regulatory domain-containing protein [Bacteroidota bacterium]
MRFALLFAISLLICSVASAQLLVLKGKVTDQNSQPVPFASIYIRNTNRGASANGDGDYSIKLAPGQYEILYRAVGYKQESRKIDLHGDQILDVRLSTETYELKAVTINATGE